MIVMARASLIADQSGSRCRVPPSAGPTFSLISRNIISFPQKGDHRFAYIADLLNTTNDRRLSPIPFSPPIALIKYYKHLFWLIFDRKVRISIIDKGGRRKGRVIGCRGGWTGLTDNFHASWVKAKWKNFWREKIFEGGSINYLNGSSMRNELECSF